ncbi:MAG: hypothetical protein ACRYGP_16820 [Janthinobacterium lividum]
MSITQITPPIPEVDFSVVDPDHDDLPYEERLLEAMTPRMEALLGIGRAAYIASATEHGDVGTCGFAWVVLEITPETKPTIRWFREDDHGRLDGWHLNYKIGPSDFLEDDDPRVQALATEEAACEALAAALRSVGVPCDVQSVVD